MMPRQHVKQPLPKNLVRYLSVKMYILSHQGLEYIVRTAHIILPPQNAYTFHARIYVHAPCLMLYNTTTMHNADNDQAQKLLKTIRAKRTGASNALRKKAAPTKKLDEAQIREVSTLNLLYSVAQL
jgi:hypothetical protein